MSTREPPRFAAWLLTTFVTTRRRESLLGDLFEEYQAGRTLAWYWRETLVALLIAALCEGRGLLSCRAAQVFLALSAYSAPLVWFFALSEQYRQRCPAPPVLLSGSIVLVTCTAAAIAIACMLWQSPRLRPGVGRPRFLRLSVVAFAAIGFSGGAVTWAAGTTFCYPDRPACSSSYEMAACVPGGGNSNGRQSVSSNHPSSVLARGAGGIHLSGR